MTGSFFERIRSFFESFFKSKPTGVAVLSLPALEAELTQRQSKIEKSLELECAKLLAEVKFLHGKALAIIRDVTKKELSEKENVRFNKAALTAKSHIEIQLLRTLEKIDPRDRGKTITDLRAYTAESTELLVKEVIHFRKSIVYTSVYLKDEMKGLGETMQALLEKYAEIKKALDENENYFVIEKIRSEIIQLKQSMRAVTAEEKAHAGITTGASEKEKVANAWKQKIIEFESGDKMARIKLLEEEKQKILSEKQSLKTELSSLLATIDKPLARFSQLVESGRWKVTPEEKNILNGFLTNPILTLRSDPKGIVFKQILAQIVTAIELEKIDFKDKEKEKKLAALNEIIAFDFFDKMFWRMNELQRKQTELDKKLSHDRGYEELERLKAKEREALREVSAETEKQTTQHSQTQSAREKRDEIKARIEEKMSKLLGKTTLLTLEQEN